MVCVPVAAFPRDLVENAPTWYADRVCVSTARALSHGAHAPAPRRRRRRAALPPAAPAAAAGPGSDQLIRRQCSPAISRVPCAGALPTPRPPSSHTLETLPIPVVCQSATTPRPELLCVCVSVRVFAAAVVLVCSAVCSSVWGQCGCVWTAISISRSLKWPMPPTTTRRPSVRACILRPTGRPTDRRRSSFQPASQHLPTTD